MTVELDTIDDTNDDVNIDKPKKYCCVVMNDDYSTFELVEYVAMKILKKTSEEAEVFALTVHLEGKALSEPYSFEVAEQKVYEIMSYAKSKDQPLLVNLEPME